MLVALKLIGAEFREHWRSMLLFGITLALVFQVLMLVALMVRFEVLPNYVTFYNWPANVAKIISSTPSWSDVGPIVAEEWLVEIGRMNYDFGNGLSEWSLNVIPSRLLILALLGGLGYLCIQLARGSGCSAEKKRGAFAVAGTGSLLVMMTNATMSWVVCCATPTWVVGLAMLGLGVSTSLALENLGPALSYGGFALLLLTALALAWRRTGAERNYRALTARIDHA